MAGLSPRKDRGGVFQSQEGCRKGKVMRDFKKFSYLEV